jgi:hypothetical protein
VDDDQVLMELTGTVESITCRTGPPWQNPDNRFNVDADPQNRVTPQDALLIINRLIRSGASDLPDPLVPGGEAPPPYYDVDGNGRVAPRDALLVINYLIDHGVGEGEQAGPAAMPREPGASATLAGHLGGAGPQGQGGSAASAADPSGRSSPGSAAPEPLAPQAVDRLMAPAQRRSTTQATDRRLLFSSDLRRLALHELLEEEGAGIRFFWQRR